MAIEFIRIKVTAPDSQPLQLFGSVLVRQDGTADYFGDAMDYAEDLSKLLDSVTFDVPFDRITMNDVNDMSHPKMLIDFLRIGETRIVGPLLLRVGKPPAVGGQIKSDVAARVHRVLQDFASARAPKKARAAA